MWSRVRQVRAILMPTMAAMGTAFSMASSDTAVDVVLKYTHATPPNHAHTLCLPALPACRPACLPAGRTVGDTGGLVRTSAGLLPALCHSRGRRFATSCELV